MKTAIITGASGSLGQAVVGKFLKDGYRVIGTVSPASKKDRLRHKNLEIVEVNLASEPESRAFVRSTVEKYKKIDALLLLAGGFGMGGIAESDQAALQQMISLNFYTAYFTAREVFGHMLQQEYGRIVLIGARPVLEPARGKNVLPYTLSKSMLFQLSELLNAEGNNKNVISVLVIPDIIDTPENRRNMPKADFSRWAPPEEIAGVIAFACSENARIIKNPVFKL